MADFKDVIDTLDKAADGFGNIANAEQKKIYEEVVTLAKDLETDAQGKVKQTITNLKRLNQIKAKLAALSKDKEWVAGIGKFVKYFNILQKQQNAYFSTAFPKLTLGESAKKRNEMMKQIAVNNTIEALMGDGLKANVTDKLNDILLRGVTSGAKWADLQQELRDHLMGKEGGQGAFARYATTYATTALSQYTGQTNQMMTKDLGLEWFMYTGSNIETTREFCEVLTRKKWIHKSEIPTILQGKITMQDGEVVEVPIYKKTNLPYGMIEGTTPENFQCNCGGWNCRHQLLPVADAVVPAAIRAKFEKKVQETHPQPQKIDLTLYQEQVDAIEKYIAIHPRSEKIKGYYNSIKLLAKEGNIELLESVLSSAKKDIQKFDAAKKATEKKKNLLDIQTDAKAKEEWNNSLNRILAISANLDMEGESGLAREIRGKINQYWWKNVKDKKSFDQQMKEFERLEDEYKKKLEVAKNPLTKQIIKVIESRNNNGSVDITYKEVEKHDKQPTEKAIIERLGGGDKTTGSCASVALAYAGNKAGLDVLDFRGGDSMKFFSSDANLVKIIEACNGVVRFPYNETLTANEIGTELINKTIAGHEYYFGCAMHVSIIRKTTSGKLEYLELQSRISNGWKSITSDTLAKRFGSKKINSQRLSCFIIDIKDMTNNPAFKKMLGYISTDEKRQKKGKDGNVK